MPLLCPSTPLFPTPRYSLPKYLHVLGLIVHTISFPDFPSMWSWSTNVTDRQTNRQTTCDLKTVLCTVVHRVVKTILSQVVVDLTIRTDIMKFGFWDMIWVTSSSIALWVQRKNRGKIGLWDICRMLTALWREHISKTRHAMWLISEICDARWWVKSTIRVRRKLDDCSPCFIPRDALQCKVCSC